MNNKGFTLVELLATMAILAIISVIAVPNVMKIMDDNKKEKVINDAKLFISRANYYYSANAEIRDSLTTTGSRFALKTLDSKNDIALDPDGNQYDRDNSYIIIAKDNNGTVTYCVYLKSDKRILSSGENCVMSTLLESDDAKNYVKDIES